MSRVVIDTNVVLDLFVFADPACEGLRRALHERRVQWLATANMRTELQRVLDYPHIARRLGADGATPVLDAFDRHAQLADVAPRAPFVCRDPDDQCFVDLAVAQQATLWSKDAHVLALSRRLARIGVRVGTPAVLQEAVA